MGEEAYADFHAATNGPQTVHGMLEDYRAGLGIDRKMQCPTLALSPLRDDLQQLYGDILGVWRTWTTRLEGHGLDFGAHMAEEAPEE